MNKPLAVAILLSTFIGCTSSVQVVDSIPTPPIRIDTVQVLSTVATDSLVAAILEKFCKGETSGTQDGTDWTAALYTDVRRDTVYVAKPTIRLVIQRDTVLIPIPQAIVDKVARLESNQERHTWRDWLAAGAVGAGVLLILEVLVFVFFGIKRLLPPIKF
jgi:hypothetical protein